MGVLLQFGKSAPPAAAALASIPQRTYWRVCNICAQGDAIVRCSTHSVYLCVECIQAHELMEGSKVVRNVGGGVALLRCADEQNHCHYASRSASITIEE